MENPGIAPESGRCHNNTLARWISVAVPMHGLPRQGHRPLETPTPSLQGATSPMPIFLLLATFLLQCPTVSQVDSPELSED